MSTRPPRSPDVLASVRDELAALARADLTRVMRVTEAGPAPRTFRRDGGRVLLDLSSNDYLGLARDDRLAAATARGAAEHGSGAGAARLVTGTRPLHASLEDDLTRTLGSAAALTFASGTSANLAVLGALFGPEDVVVSDRRNHASIIDGLRLAGATRLVVDARDPDATRAALLEARRARRSALVVEGLHGMDGDLPPLARAFELARETGAFLVVDEAHAFGVVGPSGRGASAAAGLPLDDSALVRVGTFGKAYGAGGAFALGAIEAIDLVRQRGRAFVYSTGLAPSLAAAAQVGVSIAAAEGWRRERCVDLAARLAAALPPPFRPSSLPAGGIVSVVLGAPATALDAAARLARDHAVLAVALRPPTVPVGTSRLRLTVGADLSDADLERAIAALGAILATHVPEEVA